MSNAEYCFGVRPGGRFTVRDNKAQFDVVNYGGKLLRFTVEILEPWPDFTAAVVTVGPGAYCLNTPALTP
jgi:hypothetical protein